MNGKFRAQGGTRWKFAQQTTEAGVSLKFATLIEKIPTSSTLLISSMSVFLSCGFIRWLRTESIRNGTSLMRNQSNQVRRRFLPSADPEQLCPRVFNGARG